MIRKRFTATATVGNLYRVLEPEDEWPEDLEEEKVPLEWICNTLEPHVIDWRREQKVMGLTAIPEGEYVLRTHWSNNFKRWLPYLLEVPHFTGIMIHPGNTVRDTKGCILVGRETGGDTLIYSRYTTDILMKLLESEEGVDTLEVTSVKNADYRERINQTIIDNFTKYATI